MTVLRLYRFNRDRSEKAEAARRVEASVHTERYATRADSDPAIRAAIRDEQRVRDDYDDE